MSRSLTISDELYDRLETTAKAQGLDSIERLLEEWEQREADLTQRRETVRRISQIRDRVFEKCGEMPDSTELIRQDRQR
ncbi:MAG: hypothetical protein KME43_07215 [Myxacorys chilensis ATA2-1-KO14]|jgi:hypothetical protein|nr:hypothetical protein [Myxacorys chilensis ATA2-1-KO14]